MSSGNPVAAGLHELENILKREKAAGRETVGISAEAMAALGSLPGELARHGGGPSLPERKESRTPSQRVATPQPPARPADSTERKMAAVWDDEPAAPPAQPAATPAQPAVSEPEGRVADYGVPVTGETNREKLNSIFFQIRDSGICKEMDTLFDTLVFATGNTDADLAFVGEAPGAEEEKKKEPFVGPAGQKLDQIIGAMGLKREDVYISNIVKYRPKKGDGRLQGPSNRKPTPEEMSAMVKYVKTELSIVKPKVVIALGGTAAEGLLDMSAPIRNLRGKWHRVEGLPPVAVTYHPSYVLRQESSDPATAKAAKRAVWEDMLMVMEHLGMAITDKQRSYFT